MSSVCIDIQTMFTFRSSTASPNTADKASGYHKSLWNIHSPVFDFRCYLRHSYMFVSYM